MAKLVWFDLHRIQDRGDVYSAFRELLSSMGIELDYWDRGRAQISDEAFDAIRRFEADHQDNPETFEDWATARPCMFSIMDEITSEQYTSCHEVPVKIEHFTEYSWQQ